MRADQVLNELMKANLETAEEVVSFLQSQGATVALGGYGPDPAIEAFFGDGSVLHVANPNQTFAPRFYVVDVVGPQSKYGYR